MKDCLEAARCPEPAPPVQVMAELSVEHRGPGLCASAASAFQFSCFSAVHSSLFPPPPSLFRLLSQSTGKAVAACLRDDMTVWPPCAFSTVLVPLLFAPCGHHSLAQFSSSHVPSSRWMVAVVGSGMECCVLVPAPLERLNMRICQWFCSQKPSYTPWDRPPAAILSSRSVFGGKWQLKEWSFWGC